ncbi:helix-turn-helix transcriptional regulator [Polaribacter sp. PL03]|uniref:helix-turn-helix transcriptional regulator n=1 Tax=Polaribacter sp. PL03 TaxID=3088353 RepID=UPI0029CE1ABE|nr:helix-turn-helix transcriptional regulator [Polaribacter sp. PL03]MDX6745456.1 helix-turn-helix transcriptional regulator [Polaribacter sp. PL03]
MEIKLLIINVIFASMKEKENEKLNAKAIYNAVLKKIIAERTALGITQINVAQQLGIGENGYFKIEKGKTKLDLERLLLILEVLEITPIDFFKGIK